jgi:hypothetical protein
LSPGLNFFLGEPDDIFNCAVEKLIWMARPECVLMASHSNPEWQQKYFSEQQHESLIDFIQFSFRTPVWNDGFGVQAFVITFSPLSDYSPELFDYTAEEETAEEDKSTENLITATFNKIQELEKELERIPKLSESGEHDSESLEKAESVKEELAALKKKMEELLKEQQPPEEGREEGQEGSLQDSGSTALGIFFTQFLLILKFKIFIFRGAHLFLGESSELRKSSNSLRKSLLKRRLLPVCLKLHDFSSQTELIHSVHKFFEKGKPSDLRASLNKEKLEVIDEDLGKDKDKDAPKKEKEERKGSEDEEDHILILECDPAAVSYQRYIFTLLSCPIDYFFFFAYV